MTCITNNSICASNKTSERPETIAIKTNGERVIDISIASIQNILNIYPDECHIDRPVFTNALSSRELAFSDLQSEAETLMIPWQLFFLEEEKLDKTIHKLNKKRKSKFDKKFLANRNSSTENGVSLRIVDRIIALQEFAHNQVLEKNVFCGSLKYLAHDKWAGKIIDFFEIDPEILCKGHKGKVLDKLIDCVEAKNIRVARGVFDSNNKILPTAKTVRRIYQKSSGFVVQDEKVPYVFLPNELNDKETAGRQILTLFVLLILIGNNQYDIALTGELELSITSTRGLQQAFSVATEILLPFSVTDAYRTNLIDSNIIEALSEQYMLTPSAIIITLWQRGLLRNDDHKQELLDNMNVPLPTADTKGFRRPANIDTAIKKWCGTATTRDIVQAINSKILSPIEAQYLIFGRVDKSRYAKFKAKFNI